MRRPTSKIYDATIAGHGLRFTAQRREVFDALMSRRDHPTAVDVFVRVQKRMPSISLATVYNCLETLTDCGLVRHVHHDRAPSRYCPNLDPHGHFFCDSCGAVFDVPPRKAMRLDQAWKLPSGVLVSHHEVSFRGRCAGCAAKKSAEPKSRSQRKD